jgi:hypothetical protein
MAIVANRPTSFSVLNRGASTPAVIRHVDGAIAAESTTRTVEQFPTALGVRCGGLDTLLVGIELGTGSGGVTLEPLILDGAGELWLQQWSGGARVVTPSIVPGRLYEVEVWGQAVLFRVDAADADLEDLNVIAFPGRARVGLSI